MSILEQLKGQHKDLEGTINEIDAMRADSLHFDTDQLAMISYARQSLMDEMLKIRCLIYTYNEIILYRANKDHKPTNDLRN